MVVYIAKHNFVLLLVIIIFSLWMCLIDSIVSLGVEVDSVALADS